MLVYVVYQFFFHVALSAIPFSTLNLVQEKEEKLFHVYSVNSLFLYLVNAWWGHAWQGGMCGREHVWQGAFLVGGVHGGGVYGRGHTWQGVHGMHTPLADTTRYAQ